VQARVKQMLGHDVAHRAEERSAHARVLGFEQGMIGNFISAAKAAMSASAA